VLRDHPVRREEQEHPLGGGGRVGPAVQHRDEGGGGGRDPEGLEQLSAGGRALASGERPKKLHARYWRQIEDQVIPSETFPLQTFSRERTHKSGGLVAMTG